MARVTVEDCVLQIPNRFELVMAAAHRARALGSGADLMVERDKDKNPVVSLREIAEEKLNLDGLEESLIKSLQKRIEPERPEEEIADLIASEQQAWVTAADSAEESDDDDLFGNDESDEDEDNGDDMTMPVDSFEDADIKD